MTLIVVLTHLKTTVFMGVETRSEYVQAEVSTVSHTADTESSGCDWDSRIL